MTSGLVRTFLEEDERQQTVRYLGAGSLLGAAQLYGGPVPHAQCVSDVRLVRLVPDTVRQIMQTDAAVAIAVAEELAADCAAATQELALTSFRTIRERVAHQLLLRADVAGPVLDLTQRDIAHTVGSVREVVGRTMQDFERIGAVRRRDDGSLELDLAALEKIRTSRRRR
jgi:CRP/FNR family transcriptional regulator